MSTTRVMGPALAAGLAMLAMGSAAWAQQPQGVRVAGTIQSLDGSVLTVKTAQDAVKVTLTPNVMVIAASKGTIANIKKGDYVGVGASPQADGSQKAIRVNIFAEPQRGVGEGFRPWDRPNTTMTNATVDTTVASVDGQTVMLKYKDGEKKIVIGPDAQIIYNVLGDKADLKAGASVVIVGASKAPDGSYSAARVNVGRDGYVLN
jgi:predicted SpoU family rRNA methylase